MVLTLCGLLGTWGCADDPYQRTKIGAVIGGAAGADIGAIVDKKSADEERRLVGRLAC